MQNQWDLEILLKKFSRSKWFPLIYVIYANSFEIIIYFTHLVDHNKIIEGVFLNKANIKCSLIKNGNK